MTFNATIKYKLYWIYKDQNCNNFGMVEIVKNYITQNTPIN